MCSSAIVTGRIRRDSTRRRIQKEHIQKMLSNNIISILDTDYYYVPHLYFHSQLCPLIENENDTNLIEKVGNVYMNSIYNNNNFPITYRMDVTLQIDNKDIKEYKRRHCQKTNDNEEWLVIILTVIILFYTIYFIQ